jgi:capsule polysaccharide modification protein KpsS
MKKATPERESKPAQLHPIKKITEQDYFPTSVTLEKKGIASHDPVPMTKEHRMKKKNHL